MSVVIVNDEKKLYETIDKFLNELVIEIHRIKQLGFSEYLKSTHSNSFAYLTCYESLDFFYDSSMYALEKGLKNGKLLIDKIQKLYPIDIVLENHDTLNSHFIITVNQPVEIFFDKRKNKSGILPINIRSLTLSAIANQLSIRLATISGRHIKDIVITCNRRPYVYGSGYIVIDTNNLNIQKILGTAKNIRTNHFGGRIEWHLAGVKRCIKIKQRDVKKVFSLHILYAAKNMKKKLSALDRIYQVLKQTYLNGQIFVDNGLNTPSVSVARKMDTIVAELKIPFNISADGIDISFNDSNDLQNYDLVLTARLKIDFEVGNPQIL